MHIRQEQQERDQAIQHDQAQYDHGEHGQTQYDRTQHDDRASHPGLLNDPVGLREEWQRVQGTFVDDPQRAVHEASVLVDRTLQEIHANVAKERRLYLIEMRT